MKFSTSIRISWKGFHYRNLKRSFFFPWLNPFRYKEIEFPTETIPYKSSSKLQGVEIFDMISEWVQFKHPKSHIIVITNINVEAKNIQFWAKVPRDDMVHFMKDVVILHCKDTTEVTRLVENIPVSFADAMGYSAGKPLIINSEF